MSAKPLSSRKEESTDEIDFRLLRETVQATDMAEMSKERVAGANVLLPHHGEICRPVMIATDRKFR